MLPLYNKKLMKGGWHKVYEAEREARRRERVRDREGTTEGRGITRRGERAKSKPDYSGTQTIFEGRRKFVQGN